MNVLQHSKAGTSTQKWLRIMHNRALDLAWLLTPVMARRFWPKLNTRRAKAITFEQHMRLIDAVKEDEFRRYLQMLWEIGGSQTDTARLRRDNVDVFNRRAKGGKIVTAKKLEHLSKIQASGGKTGTPKKLAHLRKMTAARVANRAIPNASDNWLL